MIHKSLAVRLFEASYIQRWNDMVRPVELTELDKNAHKMIIAYCLGKYEESRGSQIDWHSIIKGGLFELLRRVVLSDIKSPVYRKIKQEHKNEFNKLNEWVFSELEPDLAGSIIKEELCEYLSREDYFTDITGSILDAAHIYASFWEFRIIRQISPYSLKTAEIDKSMRNDLEPHLDLLGMRKIVTAHKVSDFIDLCGQLRFQIRWGHTPRIPRTSVLGHMLLVACFSYLLSREINACPKRLYNNFFGGLFHDLPEVVTRDIISPVKNAVAGMPKAISDIERELAQNEIYPLLEPDWHEEFKYFTLDEFKSKVRLDDTIKHVSSEEISESYNEEIFDPIDGELLHATDKFSAYLESYATDTLGIKTRHTKEGLNIPKEFKGRKIAGLSMDELYSDFVT